MAEKSAFRVEAYEGDPNDILTLKEKIELFTGIQRIMKVSECMDELFNVDLEDEKNSFQNLGADNVDTKMDDDDSNRSDDYNKNNNVLSELESNPVIIKALDFLASSGFDESVQSLEKQSNGHMEDNSGTMKVSNFVSSEHKQ